MGGGVMGDLENNMDNSRTTLILTRANRRARALRCRGRVRPRRPGLSKVVDVVSNSNGALGTTVVAKKDGKYFATCTTNFTVVKADLQLALRKRHEPVCFRE